MEKKASRNQPYVLKIAHDYLIIAFSRILRLLRFEYRLVTKAKADTLSQYSLVSTTDMADLSRVRLLQPGCEAVLGPLTYNQDGLATVHNCEFMRDKRFLQAYHDGEVLGSWTPLAVHWRAFIVCWAAEKGTKLDGDFVECGVDKGSSAMAVAVYTDFKKLNKKFYLIDTFHGLDRRYVTEEEISLGAPINAYQEDSYASVIEAFREFPNVEVVRGAVPDVLSSVRVDKVSYLAIDMNNTVPEIAAAEYFWEKMVSGAVMVLDDYGWSGYHHVQKKAFDRFASEKGVQVLPLPTGQGLIFKP